MERGALLLPVSGDARVVRLPGRDELVRLCAIYVLIHGAAAPSRPVTAPSASTAASVT